MDTFDAVCVGAMIAVILFGGSITYHRIMAFKERWGIWPWQPYDERKDRLTPSGREGEDG